MRVLVLGGGGREHALTWKLKKSPQISGIFCIPGNAGIHSISECPQIDIEAKNGFKELLDWIEINRIDLTIVGPEAPLVAGLVDCFNSRFASQVNAENRSWQPQIFGPSRRAAQLEGSKVFCKRFMLDHGIPTARSQTVISRADAEAALADMGLPIVLKADGLAAGKGVWVCMDEAQVNAALNAFYDEKRYGQSAEQVLVEEFLEGQEVSFIALCDGKNALALASSQDHKRAFDGDQGPNTGGMGAYSPAAAMTDELTATVMQTVMQPVLDGMRRQGMPYQGFLYAGLMLTAKGPKVLEFNCRLGDPETQPLMMRLKDDLLVLIQKALSGQLDRLETTWDKRCSACVVMTSKGYPGPYEKGFAITGLEAADRIADCEVFHAGTVNRGDQIVTSGGRVLAVSALGEDIGQAVDLAYEGVKHIEFAGAFFRKDIGHRALKQDMGK